MASYENFDIDIVKDIAPYVERAVEMNVRFNDDPAYPINRESRLRKVSGQRQTMLEDPPLLFLSYSPLPNP